MRGAAPANLAIPVLRLFYRHGPVPHLFPCSSIDWTSVFCIGIFPCPSVLSHGPSVLFHSPIVLSHCLTVLTHYLAALLTALLNYLTNLLYFPTILHLPLASKTDDSTLSLSWITARNLYLLMSRLLWSVWKGSVMETDSMGWHLNYHYWVLIGGEVDVWKDSF